MNRKQLKRPLALILVLAALALVLHPLLLLKTDDEVVRGLVPLLAEGPEGRLAITYPLSGTVFPPEIHPPTFIWEDSTGRADTWMVAVELVGREEPVCVLTQRQEWRPDSQLWRTIKQCSVADGTSVTVVGIRRSRPGTVLSAARVGIRTSPDQVGAPIFYRDVPLPFIYAVKNLEAIRWRLGTVDSEEAPPVLLENLPVCGNCHSFTRDGATLAMDVDYANDKGSYAITAVEERTVLAPDRIITWADYRREDQDLTFGLLSQISPDGRYAMSTVKDRSVFVPTEDHAYSQLFFPIRGILAYYDREAKTFSSLPGADDPHYVQSNPSWTPDGQYLLFARAPAVKIPGVEKVKTVLLPPHLAEDFVQRRRRLKYDLYRIPFNRGEGGRPEPVPGASNNGMSNFFPRVSPDGKWLVFTMAESFMLLQPDSKLYIMPAEGGTPRQMTCNTPNMNSWHSWSPNGRWLVFSSKARGPHTQLYLTHVDEEGRDTPPVLLEHLSIEGRAANIPEFVSIDPGNMRRIAGEFLTDFYLQRQGDQLQDYGEFEKSIGYYRDALARNPNNLEARNRLGLSLMSLGRHEAAEEEFRKAQELDPANLDAAKNLASLYWQTDRHPEMFQAYDRILELDPDNWHAYRNLGMVHQELGDLEKSAELLRKAVELEPGNPNLHIALGEVLEARELHEEALKHYRAGLKYVPERTEDCVAVAGYLHRRSELREDVARLLQAILKEVPEHTPARLLLADMLEQKGDLPGAIRALEAARDADGSPEWLDARLEDLEYRLRQQRTRSRPARAKTPEADGDGSRSP